MFHSQKGTRKKRGPESSVCEQYVPFTAKNSDSKGAKRLIVEQTVSFPHGNMERNSPKSGT